MNCTLVDFCLAFGFASCADKSTNIAIAASLLAALLPNAMTDHQYLNKVIKREADEILYQKGVMDILNAFGTPYVHGSYLLDLMTWRDLDIYLQADLISETDFFVLGERICRAFSPVKMSYRNERKAKTQGLPHGLYWGVYLGNERAGAWKIDLWAVSTRECQQRLQYGDSIKQGLTPEAVQRILEIKSACWRDAAYRRAYSSADIYEAVLDKKITNIEEFRAYIQEMK
jgi:hypothetical protein